MKSSGGGGEERTSLLDYIARRIHEIRPESGEELQGLDDLMQAERVDINDVRQHVDMVQVIASFALAFDASASDLLLLQILCPTPSV